MTRFDDGHEIVLLQTGDAYFPALEAALAAARREVYLETYLFADDPTGRRVAGALADAARRGVVVRVLVDGFGADNLVPPLRAILEPAGVRVLVYRPERSWLRLRRHRLRRMHRKLVVVDGEIGFCGGINLIDDRDGRQGEPPRFDFAVRVRGPLVSVMHAAVARLWRLVRWTTAPTRRERGRATLPPEPLAGDGQRAAFVIRDNLRHRRAIEHAYLEAIESARREVIIANAYFLPGRRFLGALRAAAGRGVRVRLLLQGREEYAFVHHAVRALHPALLEAGFEVFEYRPAYMHAKVAVVDREWATVGSSNIDPFSFLLSREANVVMRDGALATELADRLDRAMAVDADRLVPAALRARALWQCVGDRVALGLGRAFIGLTGYASREDL